MIEVLTVGLITSIACTLFSAVMVVVQHARYLWFIVGFAFGRFIVGFAFGWFIGVTRESATKAYRKGFEHGQQHERGTRRV